MGPHSAMWAPAMLQLVWPHRPHSDMSARADTSYLADTKLLFLDPLEQKYATTTGLIRVQLPFDWAEFVADWFAMGPSRPYLFSLMDEIPSTAVLDSVFNSFIKRFLSRYIQLYDC